MKALVLIICILIGVALWYFIPVVAFCLLSFTTLVLIINKIKEV